MWSTLRHNGSRGRMASLFRGRYAALPARRTKSCAGKCIRSVPVPGKRQQYQKETDFDMYLVRLAAACTVFPNLKDAELQNSYHAMGEEELLTRMLTAGEYADYVIKVQEVCGFEQGFEEEKEEAKN